MKRMHVCVWLAVAVTWSAAMSGTVRGEERTLLVGPGTRATIVVPAAARAQDESVRAAVDMAEYIGRVTGREPRVVAERGGGFRRAGRGGVRAFPSPAAEPAPAPPRIHVGWTEGARAALGAERLAGRDIDAYLVHVAAEDVYLAGARDWGSAFACYAFLEDAAGIRWFMPGEIGEHVPRAETLSAARGARIDEPAFGHRVFSGLRWRDNPEVVLWRVRNRIRDRIRFHHNLFHVFDVERYGETVPEVYPVIAGRRRIPGPGQRVGWQPCLTHPRAVDLTMDYARRVFAENPDEASISIGLIDGTGYCECPRCMELVNPDDPVERRRGRWYFSYANAVAERFDAEFPDKEIGYLLYGEVREIPEDVRLHPRLVGFYVTPSFNLITEQGRRAFEARLAHTAARAPRFALYDWFYGGGVLVPRLQIRQAAEYLRLGHAAGARHVYAEAHPSWGLDGFKYWIYARLMWDPGQDVGPLLEEALDLLFAEAAAPMREYFCVVEQYTVTPVFREGGEAMDFEAQAMVNFRYRQPEQYDSFPPAAVDACLPHLDAAAAAARSLLTRSRVEYFRQAFEAARRMTIRHHRSNEALVLLEAPDTLAEGMALLASAFDPDLDVDRYYRWVLSDDPFQVRFPPPTMFAARTRATAAAAATMGRAVVEDLFSGPDPVEPEALARAMERVRRRVLHAVDTPEGRSALSEEVFPAAGKIVLSSPVDAPPRMDGRLDEPFWARQPAEAGFVALGTGRPTAYPTELRLAHDADRLYIGVVCRQDTSALRAFALDRDGRVWRDDGIEILLNRPGDLQPEDRFHVIINTRGVLFDYYRGTAEWDGDIEVAVQVEPDAYTMEIAIPLRQLGLDPAVDRRLRLNVVRTVYGGGSGNEAEEISNWFPASVGNIDPASRGWLLFR